MEPDLNTFKTFLLKKYPNRAKEINTFVESKQREELVRQGSMDLTDLQKTDPGAALKLLQEGIKPKIELSEGEKKNQLAIGASQGLIDVLEKRFTEAKGGEFTGLGAKVAGTSKNIKGALNLDTTAAIYNRERRGFTANLRQITSDTGVLTQKDYERIADLLPKFTDDPEVVKGLFQDLRVMMGAKFGGQLSSSKYQQPETKGGLFAALAPNLAGEYGAQQQEVQSATERLGGGGGYGNYLGDILGITGRGQFQPTTRKVGAAGEVLTYLGLAGGVKGLVNKARGAFTGGSKLAVSRAAAAKDIPVDPKELIKAGDKYVSEINPAASKVWETLKPAVQKTKDVPGLLEKLTDWGSKAYTRSGDKRAITEGLLKEHLYRAGRENIKSIAPEVANLTTKMARSSELRELLGKNAVKAAVGAAASAPVSILLYKLLGQRNQ